MPIAASSEVARAARRPYVANGVPIHLTPFIGTNVSMRDAGAPEPKPGDPQPVAYLVEQPPGSVVQSHYHQADQFQVVVAGGGTLGRHPIAPLSVHYANAFNAYGPIAAGPEGVHYFTLRNAYDPGAQYLPERRDALKAAARSFLQATEVVAQAGEADLLALPAARSDVVLAPTEAGLGAWRHRLPAGARVTGPDPAAGAGQFWVVTAGSAAQPEGGTLPPLSTVFVAPEDRALTVTAGPRGLEVLVMQYPRRE